MGHTVANLLAKLKDWGRLATGYDRCAPVFLSAVLLGATLIFWLSGLTLGSRQPRQANLRWSISTPYYSLFSLLVDEAVVVMVVAGQSKGFHEIM